MSLHIDAMAFQIPVSHGWVDNLMLPEARLKMQDACSTSKGSHFFNDKKFVVKFVQFYRSSSQVKLCTISLGSFGDCWELYDWRGYPGFD